MKTSNLLTKVSGAVSKRLGTKGLTIKKHIPKVLLIAGIGLEVGALVSAVIAANKAEELAEDHNERLAMAKAEYIISEEPIEDVDGSDVQNENGETIEGEGATVKYHEVQVKRTPKEIKRGVRRCYGLTLWKGVKIFGLTALLLGLSTACFIGMHNIQAGEIVGLSGAYTGLKTAFDEYQKRNIELKGEEHHRMCKYGYKEVEERSEDPDTGEEVIEKKRVVNDASDVIKMDTGRQLAVFSKSTSAYFKGVYGYDMDTINLATSAIYNRLHTFGWAVENDGFDAVGMPRTVEGARLGWVVGCGPEPDFGVESCGYNTDMLRGRPYTELILDMNVHGDVYALMNQKFKESAERQKKEAIEV